MTAITTATTVGQLAASEAQTTDGSTPVLLGNYTPSGFPYVVAATIYVVGLSGAGDVCASTTIDITVNNVTDGYHVVSRTDLVPMRTGSTLALQGCQISVSVNAGGINVYVVGKISTTINWSLYMTGNALGVV